MQDQPHGIPPGLKAGASCLVLLRMGGRVLSGETLEALDGARKHRPSARRGDRS